MRTTRAFISLERLCGTQLELCAAAALLEAPDRPAALTAAGPWAGRTSGRAAAGRDVVHCKAAQAVASRAEGAL